jgi:hypothetical protein
MNDILVNITTKKDGSYKKSNAFSHHKNKNYNAKLLCVFWQNGKV